MVKSKSEEKLITEKLISESKFMNDKSPGFLKALAQIAVTVTAIPVAATEAITRYSYSTAKDLNQTRKDNLNKNIRLGAEMKVRKDIDKYKSPITDPNEIEERIKQEEKKLHAQKDRKIKLGLLSISGLAVFRSPILIYKALTGEDIAESDSDDTDMEV